MKQEADDWGLETREVSTAELDELVVKLKDAREEYKAADAISSDKHSVVKELEQKLIDLMTAAGKTSYIVDKIATVSISHKAQVTVPKSIEQKEQFFGWLEQKFGREGLLAYQSVHSATLNSLYNAEMNKANERGEDFVVPGLDLPFVVRTLSVRAR